MILTALFLNALLGIVLPSGWTIVPPPGAVAHTGTMPQGMAASPDATRIAVVESGYAPPHLAVYDASTLKRSAWIALGGAFGRPAWVDDTHVLVAGANTDAVLEIDVATGTVRKIALEKGVHAVAVARLPKGGGFVVGTEGNGASVRVLSMDGRSRGPATRVGIHIGGLATTPDGTRVFASDVGGSDLVAVDVASGRVQRVATRLHPNALLVTGETLYVAESDADDVGLFDVRSLQRTGSVSLRDTEAGSVLGVSPNGLSESGSDVLVSLGAANSIAVIRNGKLIARAPAGRYPTDVLAIGKRVYVLNGKGEGTQPNPGYVSRKGDDTQYVGTLEIGSLRVIPYPASGSRGNDQGATGWQRAVADTPIRKNGPIQHVFIILKENRSYDQVLGDMRAGNGDASLAWFGAKVTPNEHALAAQYGLFDQAYVNGEVSAAGHLWADNAFANDYMERTWPPAYGDRRDQDPPNDTSAVPSAGFLWQQARRSHVSFRDYGELIDPPKTGIEPGVADIPSLNGIFDPHYVGWNLDYSDVDRVKEWKREFTAFVASGTLPQLEFIWLPNDHTYGSKAGKMTPRGYVATNDFALGRMIETISHSRVWRSSAIFIMEDDAQDGPDHVSDQRSPIFVISPYAHGGVNHDHFSTVSILRTAELILGMPPLSTYDAMAVPLYSAFSAKPSAAPFTALRPQTDLTERNAQTAYGARISAALDFSAPDRIPGRVMRDILAHNH